MSGTLRRYPPTHAAIVAAHPALVRAVGEGCCFACGSCAGRSLERAHIIAKSSGGTYDPSNFWLLCGPCHRDQPDGAPPEAQELWRAARLPELERMAAFMQPMMAALLGRVGDVTHDEADVAVLAFKAALARAPDGASARRSNRRETAAWCGIWAAAEAVEQMRTTAQGSAP